MSNNKKDNFLAACLLDAIMDENLCHAEVLILKYKANPNILIWHRDIGCMHYAAGMENVNFAESIMQLLLNNGGDPNVKTIDGETPLHIAAFWGRLRIAKMLLDHGGDVELKDHENNTPILCALHELHFDLLKIFQNHIFEKKIKKKIKQAIHNDDNSANVTPKSRNNLLTVNMLNENKFTPNRINYNFDVTSPYYINITHRKKNPITPAVIIKNKEIKNKENEEKNPITWDKVENKENVEKTISCFEETIPTNLFKLTVENLHQFSEQISSNNGRRISLVDNWRRKVNKLRNRESTLRDLREIETMLNEYSDDMLTDDSNACMPLPPTVPSIQEEDREDTENDTFATAKDMPNESNFIKSPKQEQYLYQMTEEYRHIDKDNNVEFIEKKIYAQHIIHKDPNNCNKSVTTISTEYTIPLDYDTEELRRELTCFGEQPGPITKSTKKLYMKRLIKYKRKPSSFQSNIDTNPTYSVELDKTLREKEWQSTLAKYVTLETKMVEQFQSPNIKNLKLREGHLKTSFIYLLIDPRISENLPGESKLISKIDAWRRFLKSSFYVGKGKCSRPYSHLYDAIKLHQQQNQNEIPNIESHQLETVDLLKSPIKGPSRRLYDSPKKQILESKKLNRILDIWKSEKGVVCLHVFHNIMPVEAYTREAAIIDTIGLLNLTNLKRGDYYGASQSWTMRTRKQLGAALLYKAFLIFLAEGETQLHPTDIR